MKKKKRSKWPLILVLLIAAAAAAYFGFGEKLGIRRTGDASSSSASAMLAVRNSESAAVRGTIEITTEGNGAIEASETSTVTSDYTVRIESVEAENGDYLEQGETVAVIDRDSIDDAIDSYTAQMSDLNSQISAASKSGSESITSSVSGRVKRIFAREDDVVTDVMTEYGGVAEISADGRLKVEFESSEEMNVGDDVTVTFLNYEEEGHISSKEDGVYTAVIEDNKDYQVDQEVQIKDENNNVVGTGYLASNYPYLVEANYGVVNEIKVSVNDHIDAGAVIMTRTQISYNASYLDLLEERNKISEKIRDLRQLRLNPVITAEREGIISDIRLSDGAQITEDAAMYTLISTDTFDLKAEIDELDIAGVEVGQSADVVFDAFEDKVYEGTVKKVSRVGNNTNGVTTFTVTIEVPGAEEMKTNMSATATIVTDRAEDAVLVPVDAIQTEDTRKYVTVASGDTTEKRYVELGLVNNTMAQITDGLSEGENVVVIGTSEMEDMINMMQASRSAVNGED